MALPQTQPTAEQGLPLDSLEIKNFRVFRHLQIPKLGRVNLITGKNNVGKTTLLEALWLYTERGAVARVRQLLTARGELTEREERFASTASPFDETAGVSSLRFLFHGRPALRDTTQPFSIDPMDPRLDTLSWGILWPEDKTETPTLEVRLTHDTGQGSFIMDLNGTNFKSVICPRSMLQQALEPCRVCSLRC